MRAAIERRLTALESGAGPRCAIVSAAAQLGGGNLPHHEASLALLDAGAEFPACGCRACRWLAELAD